MQQGRDFKGVWISREVWLNKDLDLVDKAVLTEIDSFTSATGDCFVSNEYLAEFCQCSERKISQSISKLIKLNYVEIYKFDGRKRFLRSRLAEFARQNSKKCEADSQNLRDNNKEIKKSTNLDDNIAKLSKSKQNRLKDIEKQCELYDIDNEDVIEKILTFFRILLENNKMLSNEKINATLNDLAKLNTEKQIEILDLAIKRGWQSIDISWLNNKKDNDIHRLHFTPETELKVDEKDNVRF